MNVEILTSVTTPPTVIKANRVLITDSFGNPILFVEQFDTVNGRDHIRFTSVKDDDFHRRLADAGIDKVVRVKQISELK